MVAINWKGLREKFLHWRTLRYLNYGLLLPIIVIDLIVILGCMSSVSILPNLFLVSIKSPESPNSIRIGFFGLCAMNSQNETVVCQNTRFPDITPEFEAATSKDLRNQAILLQAWTFYPILVATLLIMVVAIIGFGVSRWLFLKNPKHQREKSFLNRTMSGMMTTLWFSAASAAAMVLGVDMAAGGMAGVGASLDVKEGWTVVILLSVVVVMSVMFNFGLMFCLWRARRVLTDKPNA